MKTMSSRKGREPQISEKESVLLEASISGDKDKVEALLMEGVNVNAKDRNLRTSLFYASKRGHLEVVKLLLKHKAKVEKIDKFGDTPLCVSSRKGHSLVITELIKNGANINARNMNGYTPLFMASSTGNLEVKKLLLDYGAEADEPDGDGITPSAFLEKDADPNVTENKCQNLVGETSEESVALEEASSSGLTDKLSQAPADLQFPRIEPERSEQKLKPEIELRNETEELPQSATPVDNSPKAVRPVVIITFNENYGKQAGYQTNNIVPKG